MEDAVRLAHTGWSTHRETFSMAVDAFTTSHGRPTFSTTFDVAGAWVDVERFLSGEPECMVQPVLTHDKPIVRIAVNGTVSGDIDPGTIIRSGGYVVGLVDVLTAAGNAVELYWYTSVKSFMDDHLQCLVKIKAADQPCDIDQVAFALANPSMLRRFMFGIEEQMSDELRDRFRARAGGGYGMVSDVKEPVDAGTFDLVIRDIAYPTTVYRDCVRFLEAGSAE